MNRRFLVGAGLSLVGLSAFAAAVVPKSAWEVLMMEVSSDHNITPQRDGNGQLVATGNQAPEQSYKPLIPNPKSLAQSDSTQSMPLGGVQGALTIPDAAGSDIAGNWDISEDDEDGGDLIRLSVQVDPTGTASYRCLSVQHTTELGRRVGMDCSTVDAGNLNAFAMDMGVPPNLPSCRGKIPDDRFRPIHFERIGTGLYRDEQEYNLCCEPRCVAKIIQTVLIQVSGNALMGSITHVGVRPECGDCDLPPERISGTRVPQAP